MKTTNKSSTALKHDSQLKGLCTSTIYPSLTDTQLSHSLAWMHTSLQHITKAYKLSYTWLRLDLKNNNNT